MSTLTHDKTPDQHSSIVGGSSAARVMGCTGSVALLDKIPASVKNESSKYADEGTGLHEVMAYLVAENVDPLKLTQDERVDALFAQYELDEKRFFDAVIPAYRAFNEYLDKLYDEAEAAGFADPEIAILVEKRVEMPGIEGGFGTSDITIRTPVRSVVWDWKFGAGKVVYASYRIPSTDEGRRQVAQDLNQPEPYDTFGNDQLMFYARAAAHTHPEYFEQRDDWPVDLVICQPRIGEGEPSVYTTNMLDLENFRLDLIDAVEEALSGNGVLARPQKGAYDYCYFSACKTICPLHVGTAANAAEVANKLIALRDRSLTTEDMKQAEIEITPPGQLEPVTLDMGRVYAVALAMKEALEPLLNGIASDAQAFLEAGGEIPDVVVDGVLVAEGQKLVPKKAGWDSWLDEDAVDKFLGRRGLDTAERRVVKPITPAVARTKLKAKGDSNGLELLEKHVKKGVSSGHTLAPASDKRAAIDTTSAAIGKLADKIASLASS